MLLLEGARRLSVFSGRKVSLENFHKIGNSQTSSQLRLAIFFAVKNTETTRQLNGYHVLIN